MMLTIVELAAKGWQYLCWISGGAVLAFLLGYIVVFLVDWLETYSQILREREMLPKQVGNLQEYDVVQDRELEKLQEGFLLHDERLRDILARLNYDVGGLDWLNAEVRRLRDRATEYEVKVEKCLEKQTAEWQRMDALCSRLEKLDASRRVGDGIMRAYDKHQQEMWRDLNALKKRRKS